MSGLPILTLQTLFPILAGGIVLLGGTQPGRARMTALGGSLVSLAMALYLWANFNTASGDLQFVERHEWIPAVGANYFLGVDGLGLLMVLLSAVLTPMAILASPGAGENRSLYFSLILFLQSGLFGAFTALNFFHWFLFWELGLIPAFLLIRLWGGPARAAASTQFFVYTMAGSVAMLLGFIAIFVATGKFDFPALAEAARNGGLEPVLAARVGWTTLGALVFGGIFLGLAVKVPLMPFHTWLPGAYAEAPSAVTMLLTGAMSKMGVYGFIRILLPLFLPRMRAGSGWLLGLAVLTIVCSAWAAFAQRDLKRMLAYSSINHLGYCLLAVFAVAHAPPGAAHLAVEKTAALSGVMFQMFNHGLTAAVLFWFIAMLEQRSGGLRGLDDFGGLRKAAPVFCGLMGIALFSSLGLPGLNGFVGEFLIFKGVFALSPWAAALSVPGLLVTAVFMLTLLQRVFNGPLNPRWAKFPDLTRAERLMVAPALGLMVAIGVCPQLLAGLIHSTVARMAENLNF